MPAGHNHKFNYGISRWRAYVDGATAIGPDGVAASDCGAGKDTSGPVHVLQAGGDMPGAISLKTARYRQKSPSICTGIRESKRAGEAGTGKASLGRRKAEGVTSSSATC